MADGTPDSNGGLTIIEVGPLDQRSASISAPRGTCRDMLNFEKDQGPGLIGTAGYAKYDGTVMGPGLERVVAVPYAPGAIAGPGFRYAEQLTMVLAGLPTQNVLCLGTTNVGFIQYLLLAYPNSTYTNWVDVTSFGTATVITGLQSGTVLTGILAAPQIITDAAFTVQQYDQFRRAIVNAHSAAVQIVPGDPTHPVDAVFGFNNNNFAIHDCVCWSYYNGGGGAFEPLEGHWIRSNGGGTIYGRILNLPQPLTGAWNNGTASGYLVLYDQPAGSPRPALNAPLDLYNARNVGIVRAAFCQFLGDAPTTVTRALLYKTSDQAIATKSTNQPPTPWTSVSTTDNPTAPSTVPRSWTRPRLTREMQYCQKFQTRTAGSGFAPVGSSAFSVYEYTRQGLTQNLAALSPITAPEKFPTISDTPPVGGWVNPNNIFLDDANYATYVAGGGNLQSAYLAGSGFDFSFLPPGSVITGISVRIKGFSSIAGVDWLSSVQLMIPDPNSVTGWHFSAIDKGTGTYQTQTGLPGVDTSLSFGGANDLWGEVITPAMLQSSLFGLRVRVSRPGAAPTYSLNCFTITVTYVPPSRTVYVRNATNPAPTDIAITVLHYSIDAGSFTDVSNPAVGFLTFWGPNTGNSSQDEADSTNAGMTRVIGPGEELWTGPGGTGTLLGYTNSNHQPVSFPAGVQLQNYASRYNVIDAQFFDDPSARAAFIVNGVEQCVMFDGIYTIKARTGRPLNFDNPRHVAAHLGYLHLGFASGAVVNCGTNRPLSVIGAPGSNTVQFGEPITGLLTLNGQTLGVWTDRTTRGLQGASPDPALGGYTPIMISPAIGCIENTLVNLVGQPVWCSYRGVETAQTVVAYGDFETVPLSAAATPWLQERLQADTRISTMPCRPLFAVGKRNKRQYCVFFEDGYVYTQTLFDAGDEPWGTIQCLGRPISAATFPDYGIQTYLRAVVRHVYQAVRTDGKEEILATFENLNSTVVGTNFAYYPYVVQLDVGGAFDIALNVPRWVDFNAIYPGNPMQTFGWSVATIWVNAVTGTQFRFYSLVNFDGPIIADPTVTTDPNVYTTQARVPVTSIGGVDRAYIPSPQTTLRFDVPASGRMLRVRVDANQDVTSTVALEVPRLTHLGFITDPQGLDRT